MTSRLIAIVLTLISLVTTLLLNTGVGNIPPVAKVLDPFSGIWEQRLNSNPWPRLDVLRDHLKSKMRIQIDDYDIPHIYAQNDEDLYTAQGFVTAAHRLWQMDFTYRVAASRMSEVVGEKGLRFDRLFANLDMDRGAKNSLNAFMENPYSKMAIESFAKGVNLYIKSLAPDEYPFEFKLLNYEPEEWSPLKTAYILKLMAFRLSGYSSDIKLSRTQQKLGPDLFTRFFPLYPSEGDTIIPEDIQFDFKPDLPEKPTTKFQADWNKIKPYPQPNPRNGSNNFAVQGEKSSTGYPIVANDVHLAYHLPALFYGIHLRSPNQNVMGGTIPGTPGIVIGFNDRIAWAVTNGRADVMDFYQIQYADEEKSAYVYEGENWPINVKEKLIKVKGGDDILLKVRSTHHGPILYENSEPISGRFASGLALKWLAHEGSNEILTFLNLNRSANIDDCRQALRSYVCPQQNFICGDIEKNLGIFPFGEIPVRWPGMGRTVMDGTKKVYDWKSFIPHEHKPYALNHPSQFVSSANQTTYPEHYPYYWNWRFDEPFRALRIKSILSSRKSHTPEDLKRLQMDRKMPFAERLLPTLLENLDKERLTATQKKLIVSMESWDYEARTQSIGPGFFNRWWMALESLIWENKLGPKSDFEYPAIIETLSMIENESDSPLYDDPKTKEKVESLKDLVKNSFITAFSEMTKEYGDDFRQWKFQVVQETKIPHLTRIPGLGIRQVSMGGEDMSVLANAGTHGPAWKQVVSLVPGKIEAWAGYPGGQSGHPFSKHYDSMMNEWASGDLVKLNFSRDPIGDSEKLAVDWKYKGEK